MKNLILIGCVMVATALTGCADPNSFKMVAKNEAASVDNSQRVPEIAQSKADVMLADLQSNLSGKTVAGATQSKLMVSKTAANLKLSNAQMQVILATTKMSLEQSNLAGSNDIAALIPAIVQGATLGIGALQLGDSSQLTGLLSAVANSVLNSIVNTSSGAVPTDLLSSLTNSLFSGLQNSGVDSSNIKGVSNNLISSLLSRLSESNMSTMGFETLLQSLAGGVVTGLGQLNMSTNLFQGVLNSLGQGSLSGITGLVTNVLGSVTGGDSSTWMNSLMSALTSGISGALSGLINGGSLAGAATGFLGSFVQGLNGQTSMPTENSGGLTGVMPVTGADTSAAGSWSSILGTIARIGMMFI